MGSVSPSAAHSTPSSVPNIAERAPWHSPLPYLFGGLAAMLSLIAFALVILACSYWNLSRREREHDLETGGGDEVKIDSEKPEKVNYDDKVLVIMAGNQNPTFLATPVCVKVSSAVETTVNGKAKAKETAENSEKTNKDVETNSYDREVSTQAQANTAVRDSGEGQNE